MSLVKFQPQPGIQTDYTDYSAGPIYVDSDKIRFRNGFAEKIGGWERDDTIGQLEGEPSAIKAWTTNDNNQCIAIGTNVRLYLIYDEVLHDITPLRKTTDPAGNDPFSTTSGSSTVIVTDNGHGAFNNDYVLISNVTAFNGITISGQYQIQVIDSNTYSIDVGTNATATGAGGGNTVKIEYLLHYGLAANVDFEGFGEGNYGEGPYGTNEPNDVNFLPSTEISTWSLSNYGEDLIATSRNGFSYIWDATNGPSTRADIVANSPTQSRFSLISTPDRHMICFGAKLDTEPDQDPMLVSWSDQENINEWTPTELNTAGFLRLTHGSKIMAAVQTRNEIIIITDEAVYNMRFVGGNFTFSINVIATDISCVGQHAVVDYNGVIFWQGRNNFYMYNGGAVQTIPCPVIERVFEDYNQTESEKVVAGINKEFNEVWFFYPSSTSDINDKYVTYSTTDNTWTVGNLNRSAWLDRSSFLAKPIATDSQGYLYYHEKGVNDNTEPMISYLELGTFDLDPGDLHMFIWKFIPDARITEGQMNFTVSTRKYPHSDDIVKGPYVYEQDTEKVSFRAKGRQMTIKIQSDRLDDKWRLGTFRLDLQADSMR